MRSPVCRKEETVIDLYNGKGRAEAGIPCVDEMRPVGAKAYPRHRWTGLPRGPTEADYGRRGRMWMFARSRTGNGAGVILRMVAPDDPAYPTAKRLMVQRRRPGRGFVSQRLQAGAWRDFPSTPSFCGNPNNASIVGATSSTVASDS